MAMDRLHRLALIHGIVGLATCLCLILLFLGADAFGPINDVGNGVLGLLSAGLAWLLAERSGRAFVGIAVLGAVITVVGSVLVMTGATGFFLAGLVSSVGFALIGVWLVAVNRAAANGPWPERLRRSGLIAGIVMVLGIINAPGIAMGLDDLDTAPAWTFVGSLNWAGTYLLFPAWTLRLARSVPGEH